MLQNGLTLYDDINRRAIPGIEQFKDIVDVETVPSMFLIMYLQAHHIDLEFYDKFFSALNPSKKSCEMERSLITPKLRS
jgi:hypothetical protein